MSVTSSTLKSINYLISSLENKDEIIKNKIRSEIKK